MLKTDQLNIAAELTIGQKVENITIVSLTTTSCVGRFASKPKAYQFALLRLFEDKGDDELFSYHAIKVTLESSSQKKSDPNVFYINIKFKETMQANQGIVQLMHAKENKEKNNTNQIVHTRNGSLFASMVHCHMCGHEKIPFWSLSTRTMEITTNIFGVPIYVKAMAGQDFCDYNLVRVVVCPTCFYASNDIKDFKKINAQGEFSQCPYAIGHVSKNWRESIENRKTLVAPLLSDFFSDERTEEQARLSYDLAVITSDVMFKTDKDKSHRRRNYMPVRKSVSYLLVNAELLMSVKQPKKAEKLLIKAIARLEKIFPFLIQEASIKAGFLLGMLNLYFEEYRKTGHYLTFLQNYNQDDGVEVGTNEYKVLMKSLKKLNEAYQNRKDFSKFNLKRFQKPY